MELGSNIRKLRLQLGLTQKQLAVASGLTNGMISKVENNIVTPALASLMRIAEVLQVNVSTLLQAGEADKTVMTINPFADLSKFILTELGYWIFSPAASRLNKRMQTIMVYACSDEVKPHLVAHEGDEFLLVLEGEMVFVCGKDSYFLRQGDSLYFSAAQKHGIASVPNEVKYLDIFVGQQFDQGSQGGDDAVEMDALLKNKQDEILLIP